MSIQPRRKKCKNQECNKLFEPTRPMQTTCSFDCAIAYSKTNKAKQDKEKRNNQEKRLSRSQNKSIQLQKTQEIVNKYIRLRDQNKPCISCETTNQSIQYHAGHFKPMGANQQLRFNVLNIHKQCSRCNNFLSGNLVPYRENLIKKIGIEKVEAIESDNTTSKYTVEYLHRLQRVFKKKIKLYERKFR